MTELTIQLPYQYKPRPYQLPFWVAMDGGIKRAILVWNRRAGKDKTAWNYMIRESQKRVGVYYYFLPTYSDAKKIIWQGIDKDEFPFINHIPKQLIDGKPNDTELKIKLRNGSIIQLVGTDKFDAIRGSNPVGCVFSEYSYQKKEAWDVVSPILAENGGWAIFVYTSSGMNHGWDLLQQAKQSDQWFTSVLTVDDTQAITPEALEEERRIKPAAIFQQEWYCDFISNASAFFRRIEENVSDEPWSIQPWEQYQLGVDLAKSHDWTVIAPFNVHTFTVGPLDRFNQIDWNLQKARIEATHLRYNKAQAVVDATGVGDPIVEDLERDAIPVEPFVFTERSRNELLSHLAILLEQDKIKLPNDEGLLSELRSMKYELHGRKLRPDVPSGQTDDRIMAVALAVWGYDQPVESYQRAENYQKEETKRKLEDALSMRGYLKKKTGEVQRVGGIRKIK